MDFEKKVPDWNAEGAEPSESLKSSGFQGGYRPPAAIFNWFWHGVSACLKEIRDKLSNVDNTRDADKRVQYAAESGEAGKVKNPLTLQLNGGSTEGVDKYTFDASSGKDVDITPAKIGAAASSHSHSTSDINSGTLPVERGGTGVTSNPSMLVDLGSTSASTVLKASPRPGVTGTLPVANGGTGATDADTARTNLGAAAKNHSHAASDVQGLATVATSGSYTDLKDKPAIPEAITVDTAMSSTSTNPVQNKVVNSSLSGKAPKSHASTATTYGAGTGNNYGHVKLSDATDSTSGASSGVAATPAAVKAAYDLANGKADASHNQAASTITAGTLGGRVQGNATAMATLSNAQVRSISAGTSDLTAGTSALATGTMYFVYE